MIFFFCSVHFCTASVSVCDSLFTPAPQLCRNMEKKTRSKEQRGDLLPEVGGNGNSVFESYRTQFQFLPLQCRETRMK